MHELYNLEKVRARTRSTHSITGSSSQVTELEAIDQCYGREVVEQECNSSAYMLVYIRESEAKEIMRPIEEKDIPRDLKVRLDTDMRGELVVT